MKIGQAIFFKVYPLSVLHFCSTPPLSFLRKSAVQRTPEADGWRRSMHCGHVMPKSIVGARGKQGDTPLLIKDLV